MLDGGDGNDIINAGGDHDNIIHSAGYDTLLGGGGNDNFWLTGEAGTTTWLDFEYGVDDIFVSVPKEDLDELVSITAAEGDPQSTLVTFGESKVILKDLDPYFATVNVVYASSSTNPYDVPSKATDLDDEIDGAYYDDVIEAGAGNDIIHGYNGNDLLFGDEGDDTILGGHGDDTAFGGAGNDYFFGGAKDDRGYQNIESQDHDRFFGGSGDDTFHFGTISGSDVVYGEEGTDSVVLDLSLRAGPSFSDELNTKITWMDYEQGVDQIRIDGAPQYFRFYADVDIENDEDGNAVVSYEKNAILWLELTLVGVDAQDLTIDDFSF